jgi:hypothetical protein
LCVGIGAGRAVDRGTAQLLIGRAKKIVVPVDLDGHRRRHARLKQQIGIGRIDGDIVGRAISAATIASMWRALLQRALASRRPTPKGESARFPNS